MPQYRFYNHTTKKEWLERMGIAEADEYLKANPHIERLVNGSPLIVSGVGSIKPSESMREVLKNIKKKTKTDFNIP